MSGAIKVESYHPNLVAIQFSLCQGPLAIFLHNYINSPLHCKGNAKVSNVLEILEKHNKIISIFFICFILIFFLALTITFQFLWATI
jgi:hypothetical protein